MDSFGKYLSQQRELRAMSLADVIKVTRVGRPQLQALEEDRFEDLPGDVFAVGYIRAYARCIGLNPDETVLRYQEIRKAAQPMPEPEPRSHRTQLVTLVLIGLAMLGMAGAFLLHHH